jgi:tetratricopeptide (TPR) repeat protein
MNSTFFGSGMAGDPLSSLGPFLDELLRSALSHPLLVQDVLLHFMAGRYQQALEVLSQALERDARLTHAYFLRAITYCALKEYAAAASDFTAVLDLDRTHALAYELRGAVSAAQGSYREAIADYTAALGLSARGDETGLHEKRGIAHSCLGEHDLAVENFDRALALDPTNAQVLRRRALARLWLAEVGQANADYTRAWRLDPRSLEAWFLSEWTSMCLGPDTPEARAARLARLGQLASLCQRAGAAPFEPRLGRLCDGVARWLAGEDAAAQAVFEAMFPSGEGAGDTCYWLGMALLSGGDNDGAVACIAAALDHGVPPVLLRLTVHEPRVSHLFPLLREVLDRHIEEEAP